MATVNVPREQLAKILADAEVLIADVAALVDQDAVAGQRLAAMREDPSTRRSEEELDAYLVERGAHLDRVDDGARNLPQEVARATTRNPGERLP